MPLQEATSPTLFILDFGTTQDPKNPLHCGRFIRATANGTGFVPLAENFYLPDSIDVLQDYHRLYWTCMGIPGM